MTTATKTKTPNLSDLTLWLQREIDADALVVAEFSTKLTKDPAHALAWDGSRMISVAANTHVCRAILASLTGAEDVADAARRVIAEAQRHTFEAVRRGTRYSDPMQAEVKAEIAARWSRLIDPTRRDSAGEVLQAIANGHP
jgi:hypothetical protein